MCFPINFGILWPFNCGWISAQVFQPERPILTVRGCANAHTKGTSRNFVLNAYKGEKSGFNLTTSIQDWNLVKLLPFIIGTNKFVWNKVEKCLCFRYGKYFRKDVFFPRRKKCIFPFPEGCVFPLRKKCVFTRRKECIFPFRKECVFPAGKNVIFLYNCCFFYPEKNVFLTRKNVFLIFKFMREN